MIPKECKRLAEVDFPIAAVSKHSAREKSIRHGHPSTLHLWWARRPLAACRSMLLGLLLPDPCDPLCPEDFKEKARSLLPKVQGEVGPKDEDLRQSLLKFIGDFANWDLSSDRTYLEVSRSLVKAAHPEETPLVVDPFSGGGSIPLEALRLGCEAFASDLNPVACLILKVLLEDIPRHGPELADELRRVGAYIKEAAEKELAKFYPKDPIVPEELQNGSFLLFQKKENGFGFIATGNVTERLWQTQENYTHYLTIPKGAEHSPNFQYMFKDWSEIEQQGAKSLNIQWETPIVYIWARTVRCEAPNCGAEIPLVRSFWLAKKAGRKRALRYKVVRPAGCAPYVAFEIFEPKGDKGVPDGSVTRAKATCLCCNTVLSPDRVRNQLSAHRDSIFWNWLQQIAAFIELISQSRFSIGHVQLADATHSPLPDDSCGVWFTDPPYYDSIPYAHLADCFYVWLKRSLAFKEWDMFSSELILKDGECVVDRPHSLSLSAKDEAYYERKITEAAAEGRRILAETGCGCIVFAHKTTEGWEALLSGIIASNWMITASWPIATELTSRLNARDTASLATSVHLVCRPRPEDAPVGDWGDVLRELPNRVGDWMERLQKEHIRGADLVFACIGPALEIYSKYSKVVDAEEREIPLGGNPEALEPHKRGFLAYVWEVVGRLALEQILGTAEAKARNGAAKALEEDSRLTALFLWTLQSTNGDEVKSEKEKGKSKEDDEVIEVDDDEDELPKGKQKGFSLVFDVVRRFAQPLGIHLQAWEGRIIETKKGVVRLFPISERAKQLFGEDGAQAIADRIESSPEGSVQLTLFAGSEEGSVPEIKGRGRQKKGVMVSEESLKEHRGATTLDRVHAAMLLQASGRANALRALLKAEQDRSPDFLRLANALSALYPKTSEEKRLLDAMLLAVPR